MPRRKRIDPDAAAPVDGDYRIDVVRNKDPGRAYVLLADDDIPAFRHWGYTPELRRADGPVCALDMSQTEGEQLTAKGLKLYSAPKEIEARRQAGPQRQADEVAAQIRRTHKQLGVTVEGAQPRQALS